MNENKNEFIFGEAPLSRPPRKRGVGKKVILIAVYIIVVAILAVSAFFISNAILAGQDTSETTAPEETTLAPETTADPWAGYTTVPAAASAVYKGDLILVNADFPFVAPTLGLSLSNIYESRPAAIGGYRPYKMSTRNHEANSAVITAFNEFIVDFMGATGNHCVQIIAGYQVTDDTANEHQTGMALDLNIYGDDGKTYRLDNYDDSYEYFTGNLHKYGFILRYPENKASITRAECKPGHIRYVGVPHAYIIAQNNWCLEEYTANIRDNYPIEGEHLIVEDDMGGKYEIYYVKATGELTDVRVPADKPYTISGNNVDGFVVTVTLS